MKVAVVIKSEERSEIGDCLSDANVFFIYNENGKILNLLPPPECIKHLKAETYATFLGDHKIEKIAAKDFGPKAKASLEKKSIEWYQMGEFQSIKEIVEIMLNKKK